LKEKSRHKHRFVPRDQNETFSAIFTWWNILDRFMLVHEPRHRFATGYMRELQLRRTYELLMQAPTPPSTYCEVGLNGGHSAVAILLMLPYVQVHAFDLMMWAYSRPVTELLKQHFAERFELHPGNSLQTVPLFATNRTMRRRDKCDLVFIDGNHQRAAVLKDLQHIHPVTSKGARVIVDDIGAAPGCDIRDAQDAGLIAVDEVYGPYDAPSRHNPCRSSVCINWGFCVMRFTSSAAAAAAIWPTAHERYKRESIFAFHTRGRKKTALSPGGHRELKMKSITCWQDLLGKH
jgi:hypothetical protein